MIFSTPIFIFGFLPLFLSAYYLVPKAARSWLILGASCLFYAWWRADVLLVVVLVCGISHIAATQSLRARTAKARQWAVRIGVAGNLAVLGFFKYTMFVALNADAALRGVGFGGLTVPEILLPIGLSFLTFQSISYVIDVARGDAPPARRLVDFLAFSTLFPQLIAGPVLRYKDLADQFEARVHSLALFTAGVRRFTLGLAMKLLIADSVAPLADRMFALTSPSMAEAWLGALAYSIQLLFDFAGYSAMAIGLGLMIGFRFIENFNMPYISQSITEFWRRWHLSLSAWLRDYLYLPLGGNRGGKMKTYRNLLLTMMLGGLWHGANWTFILWGVWHGGIMAIERALGAKNKSSVYPALIAWPLTMLFVIVGWVMFRAPSVAEAFTVYAGMLGLNGLPLSPEMQLLVQPTELMFLALGMALSTAPFWTARLPRPGALALLPRVATVPTAALFAVCVVVMQARSDSPFLYFQF